VGGGFRLEINHGLPVREVVYFSRPDRSLGRRRDRKGRPRTCRQRTRSRSERQAHFPEMGRVPARGNSNLIPSKNGSENCPWPSKPEGMREALCTVYSRRPLLWGIDSAGTQSDGRGRTQGSQKSAPSSHFAGGGVVRNEISGVGNASVDNQARSAWPRSLWFAEFGAARVLRSQTKTSLAKASRKPGYDEIGGRPFAVNQFRPVPDQLMSVRHAI
jgi:hypothetical protein